MFPVKIVIAGLVVIAVMAGCNKKENSKETEFSSTPATTATKPTASQDIFDEFYKEDTAAKKAAATTPAQTEPVVRAPVTAEFSENGRFVVQVSTVRSRALADDISAKLSAKGYPSYVVQVDNPTPSLSGTYYRVRIGGFSRISAARSFGENTLAAEGYEYWVDNKSNDNVGLQGSGMGGGDTYYSSQPPSSPEPVNSFQSSYTSPSAVESQPQPPTEAPVAPVPASSYTPESATKEFEATPSTTAPSPAPSPAPATTPDPVGKENEWGNEGW
jgi:hypothetical protein